MQQWLGEGELRLDVMNSEIVPVVMTTDYTMLRHSNGKCHCYCSLPEDITSTI